MSDADSGGEDPGEDVEKVAYTFGEREDWKRPRVIYGPARTTKDKQTAENVFVGANHGSEYASGFLAVRMLTPENDGDPFGVRPPADSHPDDNTARTIYVVGERDEWDEPRAVTDGFDFEDSEERAAAEDAFVDIATGPTEFSDLWLAVRYRDLRDDVARADGGHRPGELERERVALRVLDRNDWTGSSYVGGIIMADLSMDYAVPDDVEVTPYQRAVTYALAAEFREESSKRDPPARDFIAWLNARLDEPVTERDYRGEATEEQVPDSEIPAWVISDE